MKYQSMLKSELARSAGVSCRTFNRWLIRHRPSLRQMGVNDRDRLLPPKAVKFICETFDIDL